MPSTHLAPGSLHGEAYFSDELVGKLPIRSAGGLHSSDDRGMSSNIIQCGYELLINDDAPSRPVLARGKRRLAHENSSRSFAGAGPIAPGQNWLGDALVARRSDSTASRALSRARLYLSRAADGCLR
jgi:hypothetical protein